MKLFNKILIMLFISGVLYSCNNDNNNEDNISETERLLNGKHELRKFNIKSSTETSSGGWWFIITGAYSSKTISEQSVRFYFKAVNGEYILKEMPLNKVNIKIDSTANIPYVKFYYKDYNFHGHDIYDYSITRVVIYCKDDDFRPEININELK